MADSRQFYGSRFFLFLDGWQFYKSISITIDLRKIQGRPSHCTEYSKHICPLNMCQSSFTYLCLYSICVNIPTSYFIRCSFLFVEGVKEERSERGSLRDRESKSARKRERVRKSENDREREKVSERKGDPLWGRM